ncbi:hypothetical protein ACFLZN_01535 [Nanoarchaeota archaeon]
MIKKVILVLLFLFIVGCTPIEPDTYTVYKDDIAVLEFQNKPGYLVSTGTPPPDFKPEKHPFLSAKALIPDEEHNLRMIVEESSTFEEWMTKLGENGYTVKLGETVVVEAKEVENGDTDLFPWERTCVDVCAENGFEFGSCGECSEDEHYIGFTQFCEETTEEIGPYDCCCKDSFFEINLIEVNYEDIHVADISIANGEIFWIFIEDSFSEVLSPIMEDLESQEEFVLVGEEPAIIDGEAALVMKEYRINRTDPDFIYSVVDYLRGMDTDFDFNLVTLTD